jgi:hypothetical protein
VSVEDLKWAHGSYQASERRRSYYLYAQYYDGDHRLAFATEKFKSAFGSLFREFAENGCAAVVDVLAARLKVTGFESSLAEQKSEDITSPLPGVPPRKKVTTVDPMADEALKLWERNRMEEKQLDVYIEAFTAGDAYVIVWPDEDMLPAIFPQLADEVNVQYDPNLPGDLLRACKTWFDDVEGRWHLNVFTRVEIEKYISRDKNFPTKPEGWVYFETVPNPYHRVPVFHFSNKKTHRYGESELKDIIPIQDGLNKSVMDMMIAMEFASFKQRYIIGMEVEVDPETGEPTDAVARDYGVDRMMAIPDPEAKVGQFDATDLDQFLRVQDKFWGSVSRVSGTPLHYFYITSGDFPSGEAIKSSEARFVARIENRQTSFGNTWGDVMLFALDLAGELEALPTETSGRKDYESITLLPTWEDASPRTESELADTAVKKKAVGVSRSQLLKEMGYSDEEIERMLEESDAFQMSQAALGQFGKPDGTNPNGQPEPQPSGTQGVRRP